MSELFGHHQLSSRHVFDLRLELVSPLRLSSGRASAETDAPLMRTRAGTPYLPGSSLRGAIRSEVERIVSAVGEIQGLRSCVLFAAEGDATGCLTGASRKRLDEIQDRLRADKEAEVLAELEDGLCDVCRLFGSPLFGSRLMISDAYPAGGDPPEAKTMVRDGVGIDRDTGTAAENVKFDFEVLETGPLFSFSMQVENMSSTDRKLVSLVLGL
ncbi:MAG: RAMP superfamily CRISPR-associated protein, partial [Thermoanaerobaculia bacterium]